MNHFALSSIKGESLDGLLSRYAKIVRDNMAGVVVNDIMFTPPRLDESDNVYTITTYFEKDSRGSNLNHSIKVQSFSATDDDQIAAYRRVSDEVNLWVSDNNSNIIDLSYNFGISKTGDHSVVASLYFT